MDALTRERWQRIDALLDAALDRPPSEREAFLRQACGDDDALRQLVTRLAAAGERTGDTFSIAADLVMQEVRRATPAEPRVLARVGPFRILREIGRGGMGIVFLAERVDFPQTVALKVVRSGLDLEPRLVRRFLEEREILASLEHPHIARLMDGGVTEEGLPYFAMEFLDGAPIDRYCDERRLDIDARLRLFCQACAAVAYAHERAVVHRDLKPSNILVTTDGTVKLLDFGIAKLLDAEESQRTALTRTGSRILTPEYASPEQMRGDSVSAASDVYALGVLLYELLTGRSPHLVRGRDFRAIERAVLEERPTRPSSVVVQARSADGEEPRRESAAEAQSFLQSAAMRSTTPDRLRRRLRGDLDAIVLQALRKEPERRYPTAAALAEDLQRHLQGRPVTAAPDAWSYRAAKFVRRHRLSIATGLVGMSVGIVLLALTFPTLAGRAPPPSAASRPASAQVLAIGRIVDHRTDIPAELARPLAGMLATNLARTPGLRVVSPARMYELKRQAGMATDTAPEWVMSVARSAGATAMVEGALYDAGAGLLRLDLRVIDLASGDLLHAERVAGADPFSLVDSGTARLVPRLGAIAPSGSLADVTTRSVAAYRFYEEGLRAFTMGDAAVASRLFTAALREDTMFALATYYAARTAGSFRERWRTFDRAVRLARGTTERERLRIQLGWAATTFSRDARALAETLTSRYPDEIEGQLLAGQIALSEGRLADAFVYLDRVVTMDSLSLRDTGTTCATACQALAEKLNAYVLMDSLAAAEREIRRWIRRQPRAATPWIRLAALLDQRGRPIDALAAYRQFASLAPEFDAGSMYLAQHYIWHRQYDHAARVLRDLMQTGTERQRVEAPWYLAIALRQQGRLGEALNAARLYRRSAVDDYTESSAPPAALLEAQVLFEMGRHAQAAALFDSIAVVTGPPEAPASARAKARAWALTHVATARAALGDTALLPALADTIEALGTQSSTLRDRRLHHYVRGLLHAARGEMELADAALRRSITSPNLGFTRAHLELAHLAIRRGRPHDAVAILQSALRGSLEASNFYVTRTELNALLGMAWEAAGRPDSAIARYGDVLVDWREAEPPIAALRDRIALRLGTLGSTR